MAAGTSFDRIGPAQSTELVTDGQDVVLLMRSEADMVHPRPVAAGHRRVMHGGLAAHPCGIDRALFVLDVLRDAEAEVLHVLHSPRHIRGDLVEVVEADEFAGDVQVVAPRHAFDVIGLVEELVREAERVDHAHGVAHALDEAVGIASDIAAEFGVEGHGLVELFRAAHPVGERGHGSDLALAQDEVVVDELLRRAQVERVLVLFGDIESEHVDVELP